MKAELGGVGYTSNIFKSAVIILDVAWPAVVDHLKNGQTVLI